MKEESLNKTWFIDIDGTIVKHLYNESIDAAIEKQGKESHLMEAPIKQSINFLNSIPLNDIIVLTTRDRPRGKDQTLKEVFQHYNIKYEKARANDTKPVEWVEDFHPSYYRRQSF